MHSRRFRPSLIGLVAFLICLPAAQVAATEIAAERQEMGALQIETLFQELLDSNSATPVFTDLGDGFYVLSVTLPPEARERLLAATLAGGLRRGPNFFLLSTGQQLTAPSDPGICIHASLSLANAPYNYWVVSLNLGTKSVAATTTVKLTGPGLKFTKSAVVNYGADGIWAVWYNPGVGVGQPGVYTLQATVAGAGSVMTKTFAIVP